MARKPMAKNATLSSVPDDRRCIQSSGSGWRCSSEAQPEQRYCSYHLANRRNRSLTRSKAKAACRKATRSKPPRTGTHGIASENHGAREPLLRKKRNRAQIAQETIANDATLPPVADDLRCRRNSGSGWRCPSESQPGFSYCSYHILLPGKRSRSHPNSKPKAAHTTTRSNATCTTADGIDSEDRGTRGWSLRNEEKRDEVMKMPSPLVITALHELSNKNRAQIAQESMENDAMLSAVADDLRCMRNSGSGWRCPSESQPGFSYCSYHILLGKHSRSHPNSKPKPGHTATTRSNAACTTADGIASEDHGIIEWSPGNEEMRDEVMKVSSPLVRAALRGLATKNRGIVKRNLNPKGVLLGLTKRMSIVDPIYILKQTKVVVEIRICKDKKGNSYGVYKFCGQTEDEAALAAMEFLQGVLFEISDINRTGIEKRHGGFEEMMAESAEHSVDWIELKLDREEVLLEKCKYIIDSAIEDIEARQRKI